MKLEAAVPDALKLTRDDSDVTALSEEEAQVRFSLPRVGCKRTP
jgi:hypothetical protein